MKESTSSPGFLNRTGLVALITGLVWGCLALLRTDPPTALGFVFALVWALANFWVLGEILKAATNPAGPRKTALVGWTVFKVVVLYGSGVWVLTQQWFPLPALAAGLVWPLVVVVFRALGAMVVDKVRVRPTA